MKRPQWFQPTPGDLRKALLISALAGAAAVVFPAAAAAQALNIDLGSGAGLTERVVQLIGLSRSAQTNSRFETGVVCTSMIFST